jgi:ribosomal protein S18 acetylase RimI-like enzyme
LIIRFAKRTDLPRIAEIQFASWKDAYAEVLPADYRNGQMAADLRARWESADIRPDDVMLVAEKTAVIGFIAVWCRPDPFIDNLHVIAGERSCGVGAALMRSAAGRLSRMGRTAAHLWAVEQNPRAIRFYLRLGGIRQERAVKVLFGHPARCVKIVWPDISILAANSESFPSNVSVER